MIDQQPKQIPLPGRDKTVKDMSVLPHREMREDAGLRSDLGQLLKT